MTDFSRMQADKKSVSSFEFRNSIFTTAYLPPISYFIAMVQSEKIWIEANENYIKQTYRNRCKIATANGIETLSIPIESNFGKKNAIRDVRISDHGGWQKNHWRAIESAYKNSPFFEYLEDDFSPFYHKKKWKFLLDYNMELLTLVLNFLELNLPISLTEKYIENAQDIQDFREIIHPKKKTEFISKPYYQVFANKFGFLEDLSILDLIFNMGNEAIFYLSPTFTKRKID